MSDNNDNGNDEEKEFPVNRWGAPQGDGVIHLMDLDFDFEDYFKRHREGNMSDDEKQDFSARIGGMFCRDFYKSGGDASAIQPWVMSYIVDRVFQSLGGVPWGDLMNLPWDNKTKFFTPKGQRAFDIYAHVENTLKKQPDANVTDLISEAARNHNVSYETARADYYAMKKGIKWKTGIPPKFLFNDPDS